MTLTLDLPSDVEDAIRKSAQENGLTVEQEVIEALRRLYVEQPLSVSANA